MKSDIMVTKSTLPSLEEYIDEIKDIWDSHWLTNMGEKHEILETRLKEYLDVEKVSLFCNGHMALELLLQAMELKGEVITTPFTFASTTHAIVRNGLVPVFCDINERDYTIDVDKIEDLITENTSAILPVHVYGNICDVDKIEQIAQKYKLKVIYDAAHAFGVKYREQGIGNFGDAAMFSFHATKVFNSIEGGGVSFSDDNLGKKLYQLKNFGIKNQEEVDAHVEQQGKGIGRFRYKNLNDDDVIDENDQMIIGNPNPEVSMGLNLDLKYKGLTLSLFFNSEVGFDIYNTTRRQLEFMSYGGSAFTNRGINILNAWTPENTTATIPMVSITDNNNEMRMSTYFVEDGSYCKLKYIKLGYDFPKVVTKAIHAQNLNIFFQVENVFTATKYSGLDPELPLGAYGARVDNGPYPRSRNFSMGVNLAF